MMLIIIMATIGKIEVLIAARIIKAAHWQRDDRREATFFLIPCS